MARKSKLSKDQHRDLHDLIHNRNLTYRQIEEIARDIRDLGRKR